MRTSDRVDLTPSRRSLMKMAAWGAMGAASLGPLGLVRAQSPGGLVNMAANENPYGPSPKAVAAMGKALNGVNRYTWQLGRAFTDIIAAREGVAKEQVMITNGSGPILSAFSEWLRDQGGELVTSMTTFEAVPRVAKAYGVAINDVPLNADMDFDLEAMAARVGPKTGAVYLCNPNNPTARALDPAKLESFVDEVSRKCPVFVDEAYIDVSDDYPAGVMSKFVAEGRPVIVARTFSKLYAMAGQRLGYGLMPEEMIKAMRTRGRLNSVNHLALVGGMAALEDDGYFNAMRAKLKRGREQLVAIAKDLGRPYALNPQANFIYMDTGMKSADFAAKMREQGVWVSGGRWLENPEWSRISVGLEHEIEKYHEAMKAVLRPA